MIDRALITGLVLAGGRGTRMGGADKGLQLHDGRTLASHALARLAPQVGNVAISANRHLAEYGVMGAPVWPDTLPDYPGPLGGFLTGLEHVATPWLATVPCDSPSFPDDLVARLAEALDADGNALAIAATPQAIDGSRLHPVFCLMRRDLADDLRGYLERGQRKVAKWAQMQPCSIVVFDDAGAFANANTIADLAQLAPAAAR